MAKKNWRDSGNDINDTGTKRTGGSGSTDSDPSGAAGKAVTLLLAAGLLGGLIAFLFKIIWPAVVTPVFFYEAFPHSLGKVPLSTSAFKIETLSLIGNEKTNGDLKVFEANLESPADISELADNPPLAGGPQKDVAFFYFYADIVLDNDGKPFVITSGDATESSGNRPLLELLKATCSIDLENGGEEPETGNQRVVLLDTGRLDGPSFANITPQAVGSAVAQCVTELKTQKVPNAENLWVMVATDDYQLGWNSPELNSSVFGYFFSRGLKGDADADENRVVTLAELYDYIRDSTARWVQDYRDSVQTPRLIANRNLEEANSVELIYHHNEALEPLTELNKRAVSSELWRRGYQVQQPHRRQAICSKLVRLEQVRLCNSPEFDVLTNQVSALLKDAEARYRFEDRAKTSVFTKLDFEQLKTALDQSNIDDLSEMLDPASALAPAERKAAKAKAEAKAKKKDASPNPEAAEPQEAPAKPPSPRIQKLTPDQRLALVWHHLIYHPYDAINLSKFQKLINLIRFKEDMRACNELVEMQFLELLAKNLPWNDPSFNNQLLFDALSSFDASQSLLEGSLTSISEKTINDERLSDQDRSVVLSNWKHVNEAFQDIEQRRRRALDLAIASKTEPAMAEFSSILEDYETVRNRANALFRARKYANDLLFVLPYVRSFSLRKSIYRNESVEEGTSGFHPSLEDVIDLENEAKKISKLVSGSAMESNRYERLVAIHDNSRPKADAIRNFIAQMASQLAAKQSASKYAFEAQTLLGTPIPEWIDDGKGTTRDDIQNQLDGLLSDNQKTFFAAKTTDQESPLDVDQLASDHLASVEQKLVHYAETQRAREPALSLATGLEQVENWNQLQSVVANLPSINDLKNRTPGADDGLLDEPELLSEELLRLEEIDRKIRTSDPGIGLTKTLSDVSQQQSRLLLFDWERRKLNRAIRDFWGDGDVANKSDIQSPFIRRVNQHAKNLDALAESTEAFTLDDVPYRAYDPESLSRFGKRLSGLANDTWKKFSRMKGVWIYDQNPYPVGKPILLIPESASSKQLGLGLPELDSVLADESYFPPFDPELQNTKTKQLIGQRVRINQSAFFDELNVTDAVSNNSRAEGEIYFRGHLFNSGLQIVRQKSNMIPSAPYVFEPPYIKNDKSWVSVINQENKKVDVIFLLDCSGTMSLEHRGRTRMALLKQATRDIMLEFAKSERFYVGLAAFGHRVKFTQIVTNGKYEYEPNIGVHPIFDWEMLFRIPRQPTGIASVEEILDQFAKLTPRGSTPLYYSMVKTLDSFPRSGRKQILIVVTDGDDAPIKKSLSPTAREKAFPPNKGEGDLTKLSDLQQKMSQSNVQVLMLRVSNKFDSQIAFPAPHRVVNDLNGDFSTPMKNAIYDFIGRYKFSVKPSGQGASPNDYRDMGTRKAEITVASPKSQFDIRAHGVPVPASRNITLSGGEEYEFVYDNGQINHNDAKTRKVVQGFLPPMVKDLIPMASGPHKIGRLGNYMNDVVFGFAAQRGISQAPSRVWARVSEVSNDGATREFDVTRPTQKFAGIPTFSFQMPDAIRSRNINLTLYVLPGDEKASTVAEADGKTNFIEFKGGESGEFRGLKYSVKVKDGTPDRLVVEIASTTKFIESAFHLECPNSKPIETSIDQKRVIRDLVYVGDQRWKETFEFEVPESKEPTFQLYVQPKEKYAAAIGNRPAAQSFKKCKDPIFGDDVIAIQFDGIELKR